jgi:hypothetical protein
MGCVERQEEEWQRAVVKLHGRMVDLPAQSRRTNPNQQQRSLRRFVVAVLITLQKPRTRVCRHAARIDRLAVAWDPVLLHCTTE